MHTLKQQYDIQIQRAKQTAMFYGIEVDVVLVKHKNSDKSRISILGNAISFAAANIWREAGSQVRTLWTYDATGNKTKPKRK